MNATNIANMAHAAAEKIIARMGVPEDMAGVARVAAGCDGLDADGPEGELYTARMIGHFVNVSCGMTGR